MGGCVYSPGSFILQRMGRGRYKIAMDEIVTIIHGNKFVYLVGWPRCLIEPISEYGSRPVHDTMPNISRNHIYSHILVNSSKSSFQTTLSRTGQHTPATTTPIQAKNPYTFPPAR